MPHRVATLLEPDDLREVDQGTEDVVIDEVLRQVDVQVGQPVREPLGAAWILGEPAPQVRFEPAGQLGEARPGRGGRGVDRCLAHDHAFAFSI